MHAAAASSAGDGGSRIASGDPMLGAGWPIDRVDAFPPAKSDEEIARLVTEMSVELGVADPSARARAQARRRRRRARLLAAAGDTVTRPRAAPPPVPRPGPPPLPVWAWPDTASEPR